jgi:hypothetical protein
MIHHGAPEKGRGKRAEGRAKSARHLEAKVARNARDGSRALLALFRGDTAAD